MRLWQVNIKVFPVPVNIYNIKRSKFIHHLKISLKDSHCNTSCNFCTLKLLLYFYIVSHFSFIVLILTHIWHWFWMYWCCFNSRLHFSTSSNSFLFISYNNAVVFLNMSCLHIEFTSCFYCSSDFLLVSSLKLYADLRHFASLKYIIRLAVLTTSANMHAWVLHVNINNK